MTATPLGRLAHPADVALAVACQADEGNAFLTGTPPRSTAAWRCADARRPGQKGRPRTP
ncbi:hypothetical protein [Streptomyces fuscichromogenes]|uniref:hypothetical protein n=1 Tax=Streptomyces fuscichromogenes TaxID=1324013 RepID=UPI0016702028|nr:hypothetical protein [Streptomyces fuscichromogenes]